jgi:hypothetical protein
MRTISVILIIILVIGVFLWLIGPRFKGETFTVKGPDGQMQKVYVPRYGLFNPDKKMEGAVYEVSARNVIWSIILSETVVAPVVLIGLFINKPVAYNPPVK